jgi:acetoacetyl-CoA synthetase
MALTMSPLWRPSPQRVAQSRLTAFTAALAERAGRSFPDYPSLHRYSVTEAAAFWTLVWDECGIVGERGEVAAIDLNRMPGGRFFPDARLSFVDNVLRRRDDAPAIVAVTEHRSTRTVSWAELGREVTRVAAALRAAGVRSGDRVGGIVANVPEAISAALGAAALGAIWSSCSPDFGVQGILDRFGQIAPKAIVSVDGYVYGGKGYDCLPKLAEVTRQLPSAVRTVVVPLLNDWPELSTVNNGVRWDDWLAPHAASSDPFERFAFNHPLYVLYSSGTTGAPKCIVHGAGGTLIQHLKEHQLHCDVHAGDRVFYFTTCGWMMWNWLVTALASEATLVLYDGSPFHPDGRRLFDLADQAGITLFGTSAKFLDAVRKAELTPRTTHSLSSVRTITSTGSPLAPESFDFVYREIKTDVHLASIAGGTDIVSLFVGGNPTAPVWRGEIQALGLGMDVDVFDENGRPIVGEAGELVCKSPFPSMPVGFWNDADGAKYHAAYFEKFPGVWCHGDWVRLTEHGGMVIYGRSDATLNPGGVRIGTAEIYRQAEQLPEVLESLAVGQTWEGDERVVLFVRLREGLTLDAGLRQRIVDEIRANTSPRHVPARIVQVPDIPRTKSGKIVELAVRSVIHGREVKNRDALANPESLDFFRHVPELQS